VAGKKGKKRKEKGTEKEEGRPKVLFRSEMYV